MKELQDIVAEFNRIRDGDKMAAIATIVDVSGSTYRRPGARMLITLDGATVGSISGGCLERDVFDRAMLAIKSGEPELVTYDTTSGDDLVWGLRLGCNGVVRILIQPLTPKSDASNMKFLAECLKRRQSGVLATVFRVGGELCTKAGDYLTLHSDDTFNSNISDSKLVADILVDARSVLQTNKSTVKIYFDRVEVFIEAMVVPVQLAVFGIGHDALPVIRFAKELGWYVTAIDSRPAYATSNRIPLADAVILCRPENIQEKVNINNRTVAVVMTHNYQHDLELLKILLPSTVQYIGILGPKKRTDRLLSELLTQGITPSEAQLKRLYAPIGVDIGADTPEEIALAIVAEIKAVLANRAGGLLRDRNSPIH